MPPNKALHFTARTAPKVRADVRQKIMKLNTTSEDDPAFVRIVSSILDAVIADVGPDLVAAIQIDNWFDHKWLNFSGVVHLQVGAWVRPITLPPFNPHRVKSQAVFGLTDGTGYQEVDAPPIHVERQSKSNLHNKFKDATDSGVFAWWSSNTVENGKGSLMIYVQKEDDTSSWYVSFDRKTEWRVNKTKRIPVEVVAGYMGEVEPTTGEYSHVPRETLS